MIDSRVVEYIKTSLAQGRSREDLFKELLAQGWTAEVIQENFDAVESNGAAKKETKGEKIAIEKEPIRRKKNRIFIALVLVAIVLIGAGITGYFILKGKSQKIDFNAIEQKYQESDFYETLIDYHKNKNNSAMKEAIVKVLEKKADEIINKEGIITAITLEIDYPQAWNILRLLAQTKDPFFYDYFVSLIEKLEPPQDKLAIMFNLAFLGDSRSIPVIEKYSTIDHPLAKEFSYSCRMQLGDESVLNNLLESSKSSDFEVKENALFGLGYSNSRQAIDRLNEVVDNKESAMSDARDALVRQKIRKMSVKEAGNYLLSLESEESGYRRYQDKGVLNTNYLSALVIELPFDAELSPKLISLAEETLIMRVFEATDGWYPKAETPEGIKSELGARRRFIQEYFLRSFINSDNLRPWVEEKLLALKKLPVDQCLKPSAEVLKSFLKVDTNLSPEQIEKFYKAYGF